ncbi:MAG: proline--tRNA ligase [Candidatus Ancillula trichonymphae]|jgi:prolyl-tRNA synthetase|nr:proline--tRNA ligase [Candidatus Ancillula trichonymphae]
MGKVTLLSKLFTRTLRNDPTEADVEGHKLLLRAGYVRQVSSGIFAWLPLGLMVCKKIEEIIREEMHAIGCQELHFPALLPREPYEITNRWTEYGHEIFRLKDRRQKDYLLAPTHEEMFTLIVKDLLNSYKDLPVSLFQIQIKYRDEMRPRAGVIRSREFVMKDAYSFDLSDEEQMKSYFAQRGAHEKIFTRLKLPYRIVKAVSGAMGGSMSEEFLSPTPVGEDTFVVAPSGYAANVEAAVMLSRQDLTAEEIDGLPSSELVDTPNLKTIEEVSEFLSVPYEKLLKSVYLTLEHNENEGNLRVEVVVICIPGDRELDMKRVEAFFAPATVRITTPEDLRSYPELVPGFVGPSDEIGKKVRYFFDTLVYLGSSWVAGANAVDSHVLNLTAGRDFRVEDSRRIGAVCIKEGDLAGDGSGAFEIQRGVEIGHIFALGRKYTEAMDVKILDENGRVVVPTMGSYGIGVTRLLGLLAENYHDEDGLVWPKAVAPAIVHVVVVSKAESVQKEALDFASRLADKGVDVLVDERKASPGVKFKDAGLLGCPLIVVFGRGFENADVEGQAEIQIRQTSSKRSVLASVLLDEVLADIEDLR